MLQTFRLAPVLIGLAVLASGCGADPVQETKVGQTLDRVREARPSATLLIYDLSQPVLGRPATYADDLPQDDWVVISHCPEPEAGLVPLGVIPRSEYGRRVEAGALAGDYDALLAECS